MDRLASPHRHLGPRRQAGPEAVRRHRPAIAEFTPVVMSANEDDYANCKAVFEDDENVTVIEMHHRRRLVPRHRRHLRHRRQGRQARLRLALQRLRRLHRRPVLPVEGRRPDRLQDGRAVALPPLSSRRHDPGGRLHHGGRRGHPRGHRAVPAFPGPHRLGRARRGGRGGHIWPSTPSASSPGARSCAPTWTST